MPPRVLASYKTGISNMLDLPATDPRNWYRNAFVHIFGCPHQNWWFLAWHRAYLGWLEVTLRDLSGDQEFALPYWDWTADPTIPADLSNAADLTTWGVTRGAPDPNVTLSTASDVTSALSRTNFLDFQSVIEFRVHNPAHMFVAGMGGDMGSIATSVKDPMFWLIHAYIDNLWELWQIRQKRAVNPANMGEQLQPAPITRRVSEVLRADSLGYTYEGLPSVALVPTTSNVVFA